MAELLGISSSLDELLAAYQTAIDTYQISIVRFYYRVTGNLDSAARLTQDAFVNAYLHTTEQNPGGDLKTRIYRSAVQTAIGYYTPKKSRYPLFPRKRTQVAATEINITDETADRVETQRLLVTLPVINRVCASLHFVEGLSYARVSEITGLTLDTVRNKIYDVKKEFFPYWKRNDACTKIAILLSSYADREADAEQRSQAESHLAQCGVCRKTLEDFRQTRERLCSLWLTPPLPDIKGDTVIRLQAVPPLPVALAQERKQKNRLKLSLLSSMSVLAVILALPLVLHADNNYNVTALISRVHEATAKVSTFTMDIETAEQINQDTVPPYKSRVHLESADKNSFYVKNESTIGTLATLSQEAFVLGSDIYWNSLSTSTLLSTNVPAAKWVPSDLYDYQVPDYVIEIKNLGNEIVDGVNCLHLRGTFDIEKYLLAMYSSAYALATNVTSNGRGVYTYTTAGYAFTITIAGNTVTTSMASNNPSVTFRINPTLTTTESAIVDFWIGGDCLIRKKIETILQHYQINSPYNFVTTSFFTYPAQPLDIKPPLREDGSLVQNWQLYRQQNGIYVRIK